ncbi:hypothetical protein DEM27_22255 [Metarhizobium album]|uniref:Uncharacterized protein n=1 Tax=Metarhizobium album TaxID=2182425 RepID=A0A2U2DLA1_9HYPH|nr:hypothetical protein [Rhizobium album]PWE54041.1 hypothetical protein DEM27_22255 [Rhizobium album]
MPVGFLISQLSVNNLRLEQKGSLEANIDLLRTFLEQEGFMKLPAKQAMAALEEEAKILTQAGRARPATPEELSRFQSAVRKLRRGLMEQDVKAASLV